MARLVCPPEILARLAGRTVCVRVDRADAIAAAAADAGRHNTLAFVICDSAVPLAGFELAEDCRRIPLALMVPSVGAFRHIAKKVEALHAANLRLYLPATAENLVSARLLASLGIAVAVDFDAGADWEALADLMTWALLGPAAHAPVEPFHTMAADFKPDARGGDWGRIFFDDPQHYLHSDAAGRVALTRRELLSSDFAGDLAGLDGPELRRAVEARSQAWRRRFAEDHFCARCTAWRLCRGRVAGEKPEPDGCEMFFAELGAVIEQRRAQSKKPAVTWRP